MTNLAPRERGWKETGGTAVTPARPQPTQDWVHQHSVMDGRGTRQGPFLPEELWALMVPGRRRAIFFSDAVTWMLPMIQ